MGGWRKVFDVEGGVDADSPSALEGRGEVCGCGYGFPWSFGEASCWGLGEENAVLEPRSGSTAVLAAAAGSVGELLMIGVGGPLVFCVVESGGSPSAVETSPFEWPSGRSDPASAVPVPCECLLPCCELSALGEVSGLKDAPARPGSSSGDGVWAVPVNGLVAPSSSCSSDVGSGSDMTGFGDRVSFWSDL